MELSKTDPRYETVQNKNRNLFLFVPKDTEAKLAWEYTALSLQTFQSTNHLPNNETHRTEGTGTGTGTAPVSRIQIVVVSRIRIRIISSGSDPHTSLSFKKSSYFFKWTLWYP